MKALVLSGGSGTRLRPLTFNRSKQLLPVANRPLLHHVLDNIAAAGITEVVIVTGTNALEIRQAVGDGDLWKINLHFAVQSKPLGLAHAVQTARDILGDDPFLMYLGDNILPSGIVEYLQAFQEEQPDSLILLHPVENPQNFGIAVVDGDRVLRLVEKPANPPSNLGLVGIYFFSPHIHEAISKIKPSARGELEITDAIQYQLESGFTVKARMVKGVWHDAGKPEDLLAANRTFLNHMVRRIHPEARIENSTIQGSVQIGAGTRISGSCIMGPSIIGDGCTIEDASVGPSVAIGDRCAIHSSRIENSILLPDCMLMDTPLLHECILGAETQLIPGEQDSEGVRLISADQTRLFLPGKPCHPG